MKSPISWRNRRARSALLWAVVATTALAVPIGPLAASGVSASPEPPVTGAVRVLASAAPTWPAAIEHGDPLAVSAGAAYRSLAWSLVLGLGLGPVSRPGLLADVANLVAERLDVAAEALLERWEDAGAERQLALLGALSQAGVPYRSMSSEPGSGFDCSGLTSYAWSLAGRAIPRSSGDQMRAATRIDEWDAQPGDLVYWPGHVMMSLGLPNAVVHSPQSGRVVEVEVIVGSRANRLQYADPLA